MKVRILYAVSFGALEQEINNLLIGMEKEQLVDIKYQGNERGCSALLVTDTINL